MKRFEIGFAFTSTLVLGAACAVEEPEGAHPSEATVGEHTAGPAADLAPPQYTIVEVPPLAPGGVTTVSKAICASRAVVGTSMLASYNEFHAIVFDASGVTDLGALGGQDQSQGYAGNASGAIVGASWMGSGTHAFLYQNGAMQDLGTLGGSYSGAFAINASGQIVGQSTLIPNAGDVPSHAALWDDCTAIDLGTLGGPESFARDINNAGVIVGAAMRADDPIYAHAVVWRDLAIEALETNGAVQSQAVAINEAGTIVGFATYGPGQPARALLWHEGGVSELSSPGLNLFARGLNDRGDIVGWAGNASTPLPYAFLYRKGATYNLDQLVDDPSWELIEAMDICNDGRIVGNGWLHGVQRGFVLVPAPPGA